MKDCKSCCIWNVVNGLMICSGMLGVSVRKVKALTEDGDSDTDW